MALIIVEGCDGSGKSTFTAQISIQLPDETVAFHRGPITRDPMLEYVEDLAAYSPEFNNIICDRWHIGEMVYGPLFRGESRLTPAMNLFIELFLASRGALKLWMNTPYDVVHKRLEKRGDDLLLEQHQRLVVDWYSEALSDNESWIPVPNRYSPDFVTKMVTLAHARASSAASLLGRFPSYVGVSTPRILIVGQQTMPPQAEMWPFSLVPWRNSPVHSILTALDMLNIHDVGLVSSTRQFSDLWYELSGPTVFALDAKSHQEIVQTHDVRAMRLSLPPKGIPITQLAQTLMERARA